MESLAAKEFPLTCLDVLQLLITQPDCSAISLSQKDFDDLSKDIAKNTAVSYKPEEWAMDKPVYPSIYGVPLVVIDD